MNKLQLSDLDARNVLIALDEMRKVLRRNSSFMSQWALESTQETDRNVRRQLPKTVTDDVKVSD